MGTRRDVAWSVPPVVAMVAIVVGLGATFHAELARPFAPLVSVLDRIVNGTPVKLRGMLVPGTLRGAASCNGELVFELPDGARVRVVYPACILPMPSRWRTGRSRS